MSSGGPTGSFESSLAPDEHLRVVSARLVVVRLPATAAVVDQLRGDIGVLTEHAAVRSRRRQGQCPTGAERKSGTTAGRGRHADVGDAFGVAVAISIGEAAGAANPIAAGPDRELRRQLRHSALAIIDA